MTFTSLATSSVPRALLRIDAGGQPLKDGMDPPGLSCSLGDVNDVLLLDDEGPVDRLPVIVVIHVVDMLEDAGLALAYPHSSAIQVSRFAMRELRPKRGRSPLRVFYVFDPRRQAVLLIGGDKSGDKTFYDRMVPRADALWEEYLAEQAAGLHDER